MRRAGMAILSATIVCVAACGSASGAPPGGGAKGPSYALACSTDVAADISALFGVSGRLTTPRSSKGLYTCDYVYPSGRLAVSVKTLPSQGSALSYFDHVKASLGGTGSARELGSDSFASAGGSVVMKRNAMVLDVNPGDLPPDFGNPPATRSALANSVAYVILGYWGGPGGTGRGTDPNEPPQPAGVDPSSISKEVCSNEAQGDIARVLGVTARVSSPTWVNHVYRCNYVYSDGEFVMSVKELSNWDETHAQYLLSGLEQGDTGSIGNLGQAAFTTSDGSVIVEKDWKVLDVNIAGLPAQFGKPTTPRADVAYTIADIILGCWAGD